MSRFQRTLATPVAQRAVAGILGFAGCAMLALGTASAATQIIHPGPNTCSTDNCNAVVLGGTVNSVSGNRSGPWTIQVFATQSQCLRLSVTQGAPQQDLEMVVVDPNGTVHRDDNSGTPGCAACPLVKFVAPKTGFQTVSISQAAGTPIERDFSLSYGLYTNAGNSNCVSPTPGQ